MSHISLMLQCYFFFTSIEYNEEKKKSHSKKKTKYRKGVIEAHVRPLMA